jgi:co-chaperonin GroES (HSP10)
MSNLEKYGYEPVHYKVLLRQHQLDDRIDGTQFILPDSQKKVEQWAVTKMEVLAVGGAAFSDWGADEVKPKVGDWVVTRSHAGFTVKHGDEEYKIATDNDIMSITEAPK